MLCFSAFFTNLSAEWEPALRMYRGMFLVIMMICLLGINTYGWRSSGVNHVLIFEIDPRRHLTHQQLLEVTINVYGGKNQERTTDHGQATSKLYHLRVECTLFCNLQSRERTHAVLVIGLYELLGNPTT